MVYSMKADSSANGMRLSKSLVIKTNPNMSTSPDPLGVLYFASRAVGVISVVR